MRAVQAGQQIRPRTKNYVPLLDKVQKSLKEATDSEIEEVIKAVGGGKLSEAVFETWVYIVARLAGSNTTPTSSDIDSVLSESSIHVRGNSPSSVSKGVPSSIAFCKTLARLPPYFASSLGFISPSIKKL